MEGSIKVSDVTLSDKINEDSSRKGWVEKHAELIAKLEAEYQSPQEAEDESLDARYFGFSVGKLNLLISEHISSEVLEDNIIYPIDLAPDWLLGACNLRGDIVPIIDLKQIIASESSITEPTSYKILILNDTGTPIGLPLEKLPTPIQFKKEERINNYSNFPELVQPFITIAYKTKQNIWACIDFSSFISSFSN